MKLSNPWPTISMDHKLKMDFLIFFKKPSMVVGILEQGIKIKPICCWALQRGIRATYKQTSSKTFHGIFAQNGWHGYHLSHFSQKFKFFFWWLRLCQQSMWVLILSIGRAGGRRQTWNGKFQRSELYMTQKWAEFFFFLKLTSSAKVWQEDEVFSDIFIKTLQMFLHLFCLSVRVSFASTRAL